MPSSLCRLGLVVASLFWLAPAAAFAQTAAPPAAPADVKLPPPEEASVLTKDGVNIALTYYPGTKGKDTIPVILLHMFKGDRHEMEGLARFLQKQGCAVVAPDLRGHGNSKLMSGKVEVDASRMPVAQFANMVLFDMEAIKKFLIEKNNAGMLNVDKLCLVGAEMGAQVAFNWAAQDWSAIDLPTLKQSKDVKAVVMISPSMSFKSLSLTKALSFMPFREEISAFVIAGAEDTASAADAKRIKESLERGRPKPTKIEEKTVFIEDTLKTKLIGSKLLGEQSLGVDEVIGQFIQLRLAERPDCPWKERRAP